MNKQLLKIRLLLFVLFTILVSYGQIVTAQEKSGGTEIVLIDPYLTDMGILTGALKPDVKMIYLDASTPMVTAISNALKENAPVRSLHIVTHGSPGAIFTPSSFINESTLNNQSTEIKSWKNSFTSDGSILLYGCNVGKNEEGQAFCNKLSEISGINLLASNDLTGFSKLGGDWDLEVKTANVDNKICFTSDIQSYNSLFYKVFVWTSSSVSGYVTPVTNYYNSLSGHSATQMIDNTSTIPNLSDYALVFICLPERAINTTELAYLKAHLNKGGRIVWVGENSNFIAQNNVIAAAVSALGGHLSIQSLFSDNGVIYLPNTHMNMTSDLMEGVNNLWGNCVSAINIGGDATVLTKMYDNPTKIMMAQENIGYGDIVAWADVNFWLDGLSNTSYGTATFLKNLLVKAGSRKESMLVASLSTTEAYSVSNNSAISGGNITSDNGSAITERGVCWSTSSVSPTTSNSKIAAPTGGTGSFTCKITGLSLGTKYYARAYAISSKGTAYGNTISFTTPSVVNTAPTAVADNFSCKRGGSITGNVMSNDFDDDGNTMTAKIVTAPSYNSGAFTINADGSFTYTSNGTTAPSDFFSYYLTDGISNSATVGVSIALYTASNAPVGANGSITVNSNENFSFSTSNFTFSDADAGHTFNGINIVTLPLKGILKYNGLPVSAGSICNDVSKLTFNTNGSSGNTSFTFKTVASSAEESATAYTMTINMAGKTAATVTLSGLSQTYTGLPISATTTTSPSGLPVTVTYNGSATIPTNAGTYAVVATINDGSYEGTTTGNLVIGKASLTATATAQTKAYGAANPTLTFSYSGWLNGESESVLDTKPTATTTVSATTPVGVQTGAISVAGGVDNNYDFTYVPADFTITKAMLTATAAAQTKVYGAANPTLTFSYSGWKNNESESVLDIKPSVTTNVSATTPAGIQNGAITVSGGADNNYDFTYVPADFTITKAMLTATAAAQTKVYGAANPTLTFSYSGWLNGESESVLDTKPTASTTVSPTTSAGHLCSSIIVSGGADNNYDFTYVPADFTITKAMLTTTAAAQTKVYGAANPTLTFTYSGWLNGESESVLDTKPTATTTVSATTPVGIQTGAISVAGGVDNNYDFTYVPADFTITKAMLTATAAAQTKVYGAANPTLTFSYSGWKNNESESVLDTKPSVTTNVNATTPAGIQTGAITVSGGADNNYNFTYVPANFTITKAMLTATAAAQTKVYGGVNPALTFTYTGWKNGEIETALDTKPTIATTVNASTGAGVHTNAITISGGTDNNYDFTYVPASFTITKAMLTATATSQSKIYGTANPALTYTYSGWQNSDNETVLDTKPIAATSVNATTAAGVQSGAITLSGGDDNNYDFTYIPADFTVTKALLTAIAIGQAKVYGTENPGLTFIFSGWKNGDVETVLDTKPIVSTTVTTTTPVGVHTAAINVSGGSDNNYDFTYVPADFTITKAMLVVSGVKVLDKVYDGNTNATITYTVLSGVVGSDDVTVDKSISGTFAHAGVGTNIDVTPSVNIVGTAITNYSLLKLEGLKANITPKELTVNAAVAKNKIYDGTNVAIIENSSLAGVVGTEDVVLSNATTGTFAQSGIGSDIVVTPAMTVTGTGIANYTLTQPVGLKANITPKELTVSGAIAKNKVYDGTSLATIEKAQLVGAVGTEDVTLSNAATGTFAHSTVGTGVAVTPAMTITGTGVANYTLTQPSGLKADITAAPLAVTDPSIVVDKVYDGSNVADVIAGFLSNLAPEDVGKVFITATATYSNPSVGTDRTITVTYTITGPAAGNYTAPANYTYAYKVAAITPKQLTILDPTVVTNKMVDGNTVAVIKSIGSLQGVENVDANNVSVTATANYNNAAVGTNKTINIVYSISGSASANYIAPVNKVITGAKISDYITLSPLTTPTPGCEESDLDLAYSILTGTPTQYKITFSDAAHAAGIQDIDFTNLPTTDASGFLPIYVPKGAPDGDYQGTLQLRNELEIASPTYPFEFTINLSTDYIFAKFDDVVLCDNSKERFTSYQWYKDGEEIKGATKQYYCDENGLVGFYSVKVMTTDGKTIYSCAKEFNTPTKKSIVITPNPVKISQDCTVKILGFDNQVLENSELSIFNVDGIMVYHSDNVDQSNKMKLPDTPGIYIGHVTTENEANYVFKIVVTK